MVRNSGSRLEITTELPSVRGGRGYAVFATEFGRYCVRRHSKLLRVVGAALSLAILFAVLGRTDAAAGIQLAITVYATALAALLLMSGIVSGDLDSGMVLLWVQKPGRLVRVYARRYAAYQLMLVAFVGSLGVAIGILAVGAGIGDAVGAARTLLAMVAGATLLGAIVFGFSAWGVRRDALGAVVVFLASIGLGGTFVFDPSLPARVIMAVIFPVDPMQAIRSAELAPGGAIVRPVLIVATHIVAWTAIGLAGVRVTERRLTARGS